MTRERAPFRDDIDLDELSSDTWVDYDVEPSIVEAIQPNELFVADLLQFTVETAQRMKRDHEGFVADVELGAYDKIDHVYR